MIDLDALAREAAVEAKPCVVSRSWLRQVLAELCAARQMACHGANRGATAK